MSNCELSISHAQFLENPEYCNNEDIMGQGLVQENNCYTFQLTIQANSVVEGRTIDCKVDINGSEILINSTTLHFTRGNFIRAQNMNCY